jgi:hypothetical protein
LNELTEEKFTLTDTQSKKRNSDKDMTIRKIPMKKSSHQRMRTESEVELVSVENENVQLRNELADAQKTIEILKHVAADYTNKRNKTQ